MFDETQKDLTRRDPFVLKQLLESHGAAFHGNACKCPIHGGKDPSSGIYQGDDGVWRFKCHSSKCGYNGDYYDILAKFSGKPLSEVLPTQSNGNGHMNGSGHHKTPPPQPSLCWETFDQVVEHYIKSGFNLDDHYRYYDGDEEVLIVLRLIGRDGKKTFRQVHRSLGMYRPEKPKDRLLPLLNLKTIKNSKQVVLVEGEKCVKYLFNIGIRNVTTSACGAESWAKTDWSVLAGKEVIIWPDNDPPGFKYAAAVSEHLLKLVPVPKVGIFLPEVAEMSPKEDAADYIARKAPSYPRVSDEQKAELAAEITDLLKYVRGTTVSDQIDDYFANIVDGKTSCLDMPMCRELGRGTQILKPTTVAIMLGAPGAGKSYFTLELCWRLYEKGTPIAYMPLEDNINEVVRRTVCQRERNSRIMDDFWAEANPAAFLGARENQRPFTDEFIKSVTPMSKAQATYEDVINWTTKELEAGKKLIVIDPITAITVERDQYRHDAAFITRFKYLVQQYNAIGWLVTHPAKSETTNIGFGGMAGAACFSRLSHTVVWLYPIEEELVVAEKAMGSGQYQTNRIARVLKCRNGRLDNREMYVYLDPKSLTFSEVTLRNKDHKKPRKAGEA